MTSAVVDRFEVVEVEEQQGRRQVVVDQFHCLLDPLEEERAVWQARNRVVEGLWWSCSLSSVTSASDRSRRPFSRSTLAWPAKVSRSVWSACVNESTSPDVTDAGSERAIVGAQDGDHPVGQAPRREVAVERVLAPVAGRRNVCRDSSASASTRMSAGATSSGCMSISPPAPSVLLRPWSESVGKRRISAYSARTRRRTAIKTCPTARPNSGALCVFCIDS